MLPASLGYDAGQAAQLFALEGSDMVVIDGLSWATASGLTGGEGVVVESDGFFFLQLDASGNGVRTVPEPSVLVGLVSMAAVGLFISRRKRWLPGVWLGSTPATHP